MKETKERKLTEKEKDEFRNWIKEADILYEFMEAERLGIKWKWDSERFMGFTFIQTRALVKHSVALTLLTRVLIGLTVVLAGLSTVLLIRTW